MSNNANGLPEVFADQQLLMSMLMTPSHINFAGRIHGGFLLKWLDEAAYVCAARYWGGYAVTAAFNEAQFLKPVFVKEVAHIYGSVDYTGRSSMDISLNVVAEDAQTKELRYVHRCVVTMVAVDDEKNPAVVPSFVPQTTLEKRRYETAKIRRELHQTYQDRVRNIV